MPLDNFVDPQPDAEVNPEEFKKWLVRRLKLAVKKFGKEAIKRWIQKKLADYLLACEISEIKELQKLIIKKEDQD
jgi:hypothetical protein